jgi:hypothetical protein
MAHGAALREFLNLEEKLKAGCTQRRGPCPPAAHHSIEANSSALHPNFPWLGQVRLVNRPKSPVTVQDHESHKAAFATFEVTPLESSYARIFRDDTAEPTTNVAEDHNDVHARRKQLTCKGVTERPLALLQLRKSRNLFSSTARETAPCQIKLAKAIKDPY